VLVSKSYKRRNTSSCCVVWIAHVQWRASNSILATCKKVIIIVSLWLEASDPVSTSLSFVFFSLSAAGNNDEFKKSDPHTCWTISAIAFYVHLENSRLLYRNSHPWPLQCSALMKHCYDATQMLAGQFEPAYTFIVITRFLISLSTAWQSCFWQDFSTY